MSKSKGEFLTVSLLKSKGYSPLDYRYFCLNSHYRNSLVFTYESLDGAKNAFSKLKSRILGIEKSGDLDLEKKNLYLDKFSEAIKNDLNTSLMITVLYDLLKDNDVNGTTKISLVGDFDNVLSLDLLKKEEKIVSDDFEAEILVKIEERKNAKKEKDFAKADTIREELLSKGVKLIDTREGTTYELI
jgi:cysteinyl-tRNA synthetase